MVLMDICAARRPRKSGQVGENGAEHVVTGDAVEVQGTLTVLTQSMINPRLPH